MEKNNLEFHDCRGNAEQKRVVRAQESVECKKVEFNDGREREALGSKGKLITLGCPGLICVIGP